MLTQLSQKAINDLRKELIKSYGSDFELTDEELQKISMLLLTILKEGLKLKKNEVQNKDTTENTTTRLNVIGNC